MADNERILGELLEFKRNMSQELKEIKGEMKTIRTSVQSFAQFRWKVTSFASMVASLVAGCATLLVEYLTRSHN